MHLRKTSDFVVVMISHFEITEEKIQKLTFIIQPVLSKLMLDVSANGSKNIEGCSNYIFPGQNAKKEVTKPITWNCSKNEIRKHLGEGISMAL